MFVGQTYFELFLGQTGPEGEPVNDKHKPEEHFDLLANRSIEVCGILPIDDTVVIANYEFIEEAYEPLSTVNVKLAAYITGYTRLKLYLYLETLDDGVLYYNTDSVIYIRRPCDEYEVPLEDFIGEMTDELGPKYGPDIT